MEIYFKLFHSIKQPDEIELAKLEIKSFLGKDLELVPVQSAIDLVRDRDFSEFVGEYPIGIPDAISKNLRFERYLEFESAYLIQGFLVNNLNIDSIDKLVRRLAYSREIYCVFTDEEFKKAEDVFKRGKNGINMIIFKTKHLTLIRAIVDQYYWEGTEYISKISTGFESLSRLDEFIQRLMSHLVIGINRIPASTKARVGKRFLDYLAERQEPSQYLSHGLHPYKGKFHPKLARVLLNIVHPNETGLVMDNFSGSGTLLIEAGLVGLDSIGVDVNPMSVLLARARTSFFENTPTNLEKAMRKILREYKSYIDSGEATTNGLELLEDSKYSGSEDEIDFAVKILEGPDKKKFNRSLVERFIALRNIIENCVADKSKDIILLGLAIAISRSKRVSNFDVSSQFKDSIEDIKRRLYIYSKLKEILQIIPGKSSLYCGSTENLEELDLRNKVDAIINSPPYSTALDYIRNDLAQLVLLGFICNKEELKTLEDVMGGNPRSKLDKEKAKEEIETNAINLPPYAIDIVQILYEHEREVQAARLFDFYNLMNSTLSQMKNVLKAGAYAAIVIGNNLFKLNGNPRISNNEISFFDKKRSVIEISRENNVKSIEEIVVNRDKIDQYYGVDVPVSISVLVESRYKSHQGIYIEVENDRAIENIARAVGLPSELLVYRYLEKTRRGDVRWESVVFLRKVVIDDL